MGGREHSHPRHHWIPLMCDDVEATVAELQAKGATFTGPIEDLGFARGANVEVPGADPVLVYEASHPIAHSL